MDELLQQLRARLKLGDINAVFEYLNRLENLPESPYPLDLIFRKLLFSFHPYKDDGDPRSELNSYVLLVTLFDLALILYGPEAVKIINSYIKEQERAPYNAPPGEFYLDIPNFSQICQKLNIEYYCAICQKLIKTPDDIAFCSLCDQFICKGCLAFVNPSECVNCIKAIREAQGETGEN